MAALVEVVDERRRQLHQQVGAWQGVLVGQRPVDGGGQLGVKGWAQLPQLRRCDGLEIVM
jgi:hypothetical protein